METIFSSDSSSEDDVLRGVSNVVYRKEWNFSVSLHILVLCKMFMFLPLNSSAWELLDLSALLSIGKKSVLLFILSRTGGRFAMKTINLMGYNAIQREQLLQEVLILGRLHHPNIVKLYEVFQTSNAMYLIQELLSGGELYSRLVHSPCMRSLLCRV